MESRWQVGWVPQIYPTFHHSIFSFSGCFPEKMINCMIMMVEWWLPCLWSLPRISHGRMANHRPSINSSWGSDLKYSRPQRTKRSKLMAMADGKLMVEWWWNEVWLMVYAWSIDGWLFNWWLIEGPLMVHKGETSNLVKWSPRLIVDSWSCGQPSLLGSIQLWELFQPMGARVVGMYPKWSNHISHVESSTEKAKVWKYIRLLRKHRHDRRLNWSNIKSGWFPEKVIVFVHIFVSPPRMIHSHTQPTIHRGTVMTVTQNSKRDATTQKFLGSADFPGDEVARHDRCQNKKTSGFHTQKGKSGYKIASSAVFKVFPSEANCPKWPQIEQMQINRG